SSSVLPRIADRITHDCRSVCFGALAQHSSVFAAKFTGFDRFLGVIPGSASVVHDECHEHTDDCSDHEHTGGGFPSENDSHQHRHDDGHAAGQDHLSQGRAHGNIHTGTVIGLTCALHNAGVSAELSPHFLDHVGRRPAHSAHRECGEHV